MGLAALAAAIPLIGGVISGAGAVKANKKNKQTKKRLGWQIENLRERADPVGAGIEAGYKPGGFLRQAALGAARMPVDQQLGRELQGVRGDAWRYGGPGAGMARRRWQDARVAGAMGYGQADQSADTQAMDTLARMDALRSGYARAFAPETIYQNPYAWIGEATKRFGQGYNQGYGGRF